MDRWDELLNKKRVLIADGAWGTEFVKRGLAAGESPERWNLERPADVEDVAARYVEAGADIVLTNTFGGSPLKLAKSGLDDQFEEINRLGVELSRRAANEKARVFASMGPSGEFMAPLGTVSEDEMRGQFARQAEVLAAAGADGIVIETMTDLNEALAALAAVRESAGVPVAVSMTFDAGPKGYATMMGIRPSMAAERLEAAGANIVGANCGSGIEEMIEVVRLMHGATSLALWAKPNAGRPELVDGRTVYRQTPEDMVKHLPALVEAGARIIGGCCGSTPDHVRLLSAERARLTGSAATDAPEIERPHGQKGQDANV
jgi:5-methyltetrahydrofolate--homocysteine methyltransferase